MVVNIEQPEDLKIRYDESLEFYVREWLKDCLDKYNEFVEVFEAAIDLHGRKLNESTLALIAADFNSFKLSLNKSIESKANKQPSYIKDSIANSVYNFWEDISRTWGKLNKAYFHGKSKEVVFPVRFSAIDGLFEFPKISEDGIEKTIDRIKDELYISFGSLDDKIFVDEVKELARHYNKVAAKLRQMDRLYSFHVLFTVNDNSEVEARVDNLRLYQSLFNHNNS